MRHLPGDRRRPDAAVALIALLSLPLFVYGLGSTYLWQDEAQTALLGRSVLSHGVPMVGQGADSLSAVGGRDAGIGGVYFQISWLQAYLTAASFGMFGESSWSARLPFALAGWLCVPLVAWVVRRAGADLIAARLAALLTALSVPFIICARQARYYVLTSALTLLTTGAYAALCGPDRGGGPPAAVRPVVFGTAACLLVLSFDVTAIGVLGALAVHWMLTQGGAGEGRWRKAFWIPWAGACLLLAAWLAASLSAPSRQEHAGLSTLPGLIWHGTSYYLGRINAHVVPLPILMAGLVTVWHLAGREPSGSDPRAAQRATTSRLLALVALGGIGGADLSPHRYFRYVVPVLPIFVGLLAMGLASVWSLGRWGRALVGATVLALLTTSAPFVWSHAALGALASGSGLVHVRARALDYRAPLSQFLGELRDPPRGPIAATVEYLREHAGARDVLVTTYGDLPLKFHTGLTVYGGETAQLPPSHVQPDWIWPRSLRVYAEVRPAAQWIEKELARGGYDRVELPAIDRQWENREDPQEHIFANPGPDGPPVVLYRLSRAAE